MSVLPAAICLLTLLTPPAGVSAPKSAAPPPKLTLAAALAAAPPPTEGLRLSVSAEQVMLPESAVPPAPDASVSDIATAFGDQTFSFGTVTAIAPSTVTVLNTQPDPPNLAADMNSSTALTMLTASLDDPQWKMLTSEHGLGLADLSDDTQRGLFHALFNHGHLWVGAGDPALRGLPEVQRTDVQDVTSEIDATRIRLGQTADIDLRDRKGKILFYSGDRPDAAKRRHTYRPKRPPVAVEHSVTLKAVTSNILKPSDLDYDKQTLQVSVAVGGLKTVGDLVARLGQKTGLELYTDPHYAARTLTVQGTAATAPASDLLRALCVCVTGTFRKLGPAYVLTDDLIGVGVRRKRLEEWESAAFQKSNTLRDQAAGVMLKRRGGAARTLPAFGDPLGVTPEEMAAMPDMPGLPGVPGGADGISYPFAKLTPAQQEWARQTAASYDEQHRSNSLPEYLDGDELDDADLTKNVNLNVDYFVQFLVPSQNMPIDTNLNLPLWMLYYSGSTPEASAEYDALAAKEMAKMPPAPPLSAALRSGRVRAVLGHPRTATEVDVLVASMQKLGLNQLWLDVFSGGVDHIKTSGAKGTDILTEALTRTRGTGIAVYADLSLLVWGDVAPDSVRDLTIDSKSTAPTQSAQDIAVEGKINSPMRVSPFASAVHSALTTLINAAAARPGLAGFVWGEAGADDTLGYTPEMRLAFLRSVHADPLDVTPQNYLRADAALPLFDDAALDADLPKRWTEARHAADWALLGQLYTAAQHTGAMPILMVQTEPFGDNWLASWDDPRHEPPPIRELFPSWPFPSKEKLLKLAKARSRNVIRKEPVQNDGETEMLARRLADDLKTLPSDGFVLDFAHEEVTQGAAPLASLVSAVAAEKPAAAGGAKPAQKAVH